MNVCVSLYVYVGGCACLSACKRVCNCLWMFARVCHSLCVVCVFCLVVSVYLCGVLCVFADDLSTCMFLSKRLSVCVCECPSVFKFACVCFWLYVPVDVRL